MSPKVTQGALRKLRRIVDELTASSAADEVTLARVRRNLEALGGQKTPKKTLPGVSRAEKRAAKQAAERAEMAQLREVVMARAKGRCEVCYQRETPANPLHLHHRRGGSGRRRQEQSAENCIAVCLVCHRREHGERIAGDAR